MRKGIIMAERAAKVRRAPRTSKDEAGIANTGNDFADVGLPEADELAAKTDLARDPTDHRGSGLLIGMPRRSSECRSPISRTSTGGSSTVSRSNGSRTCSPRSDRTYGSWCSPSRGRGTSLRCLSFEVGPRGRRDVFQSRASRIPKRER
jgi:hypothetical protein